MPLLPPVGALFLAESKALTVVPSDILLIGQREVVERVARAKRRSKRSLVLLRLAGKKRMSKSRSPNPDPF
jgi:hypothetical protein